MIKKVARSIFGNYNDRYIKKLQPTVDAVNRLEESIDALGVEELKAKTDEFRRRVADGESTEQILPEAFAVVRRASMITLGMRHFDVQIIGGIVLHKGKISEMKTGEGKTLVATLPLYLNGITGKGAHLVTVNDYLARRDAQWMGPVYLFLGLTVGIIQHAVSYRVVWDDEESFTTKIEECTRQEAYAADITYGTNNEFGFDYLRDNMKYDLKDYVQRPLSYAIVDEVDSILIDEARTPLIISGPAEDNTEVYYNIEQVARQLKRDVDYTVEEKHRNAKMTDTGISKAEKLLGIENLFDISNVDKLSLVNNAIKAHGVFKRDVDYVVQNGSVIIVDEFTGRLMPGRRYSDGLHQALEAKEGVKIENENQTLASITFQNYFRMYDKLAGMTGTAATEAEEFGSIYRLDVVVVPTHKPMVRDDRGDLIYKTFKEKIDAIVDDINERHDEGRPVLVGTVSIEKSELISKLLSKRGVPHEVLNAKNHEREAAIVANAGEAGAVTIATNMAGRGTDIKLGESVLEAGGLHIIGTERHESRRIDNQLRGRSGRQGDPGSSRFYLSLEDDLMRIFGSEKIAYIMEKLGMKEGEPIEHNLVTRAIENAQKKVEAMHFEIRKHLLEYDNVANQQRTVIYGLRRSVLEGTEIDDVIRETYENVIDTLLESYVDAADVPDLAGLAEELEKIFDVRLETDDAGRKAGAAVFRENAVEAVQKRLEERKEEFGRHFAGFIKFLFITVIDSRWKEHLLTMDYLRDSVGLRGYGQKDPLIEYKREAFVQFVDLMNRINIEIMDVIMHVQVKEEETVALQQKERKTTEERRDIFGNQQGGAAEAPKSQPIRRDAPKVGRNDPCPCGSGKKYKQCHGKPGMEEPPGEANV